MSAELAASAAVVTGKELIEKGARRNGKSYLDVTNRTESEIDISCLDNSEQPMVK